MSYASMSTDAMGSESLILARSTGVGKKAIIRLRTDDWVHRQGLDRDQTTRWARHVDLHAGVEEGVVRRGQLAREDPGGPADIECTVVGGDNKCPTACQVNLKRVMIIRM